MASPTYSSSSSSSSSSRGGGKGPSSGVIPLPRSHIHRTRSEQRLDDDTKMYEWREGVVYHRIVSGMLRRSCYHPEINRSVRNIIQTQASPMAAAGVMRAQSGSASSGDTGHDDEWLLYDSLDEQQGADAGSPWASSMQEQRLKFQSSNCRLAGSCPELRDDCAVQEEDDGAVFELDL